MQLPNEFLSSSWLKQLKSRFSSLLHPRFISRGERGMSLIEIIVVVALLGTLMAYMVTNIIGKSEDAKKGQTKLAMGQIQQSLQMYRIHNNKYPTSDQGLKALLSSPGDVKSWRGPYIEADKLKDPWATEFQYESDGRQYKIISAGPDLEFGNADDITFPESEATAAGGS